ncbi:hypothetical protein HJFPF1_13644 [Paramyrothecium foliicola]|nr:hypothetical protein HJFPF1_13644 [Paramyrothecium foliicola]
MSLALIAEITALLYYGKTKPNLADLDQDAKKSLEKLIEQLEPKLKDLEGTNESWLEEQLSEILNELEDLPKKCRLKIKKKNKLKQILEICKKLKNLPKGFRLKTKQEIKLKQLSELEQLPATNLSERVARVRKINDSRIDGETTFSNLQIDDLKKKDRAPSSRRTIEETMIRLPRIYRSKRRTLKSLSESEFLIACAIYVGQLCGILYLWPPSATDIDDFVSIFWELENAANAAAEEAKEDDDDAQKIGRMSRGRKRRLGSDSNSDGKDPTTDIKPGSKPFKKTAQPSTSSPERLHRRMSPSSKRTLSTVAAYTDAGMQ